MATQQLRPLTLGEILDRTAQVYRNNFLLFVGVAAVPTGVIVAFFVFVGIAGAAFATGVAKRGPLATGVIGVIIFALVAVAGLLCMAAYVLIHAALTRTAVSAFKGQKLTVREALLYVRPRFWRYLWLMVVQGLIAVGIPGAIAAVFIGPMTYLASRNTGTALAPLMAFLIFLVALCVFTACVLIGLQLSMGMAVAVNEEKAAWDSIQRARRLSKGARVRIFVLFLLIWALMCALSMIAYIPFVIVVAIASGPGHAASPVFLGLAQVVNFILQTLVTPALVIGLVLVYFDQRVRLEGYDIEWMMEQAGLTPEASSSAMVQE